MDMPVDKITENKVLLFEDLVSKVKDLQLDGKKVVQTHGVFDMIHPGIIQHLKEAKKLGDILIATVIRDKDVRRGPGRPVFPHNMRVENVAVLEMIDYACIVDDEIPFECVKRIQPDYFAKGSAYKERDKAIHDKIFEEEKEFYFGKSVICETNGFHFSSSGIINDFVDIYPEETKAYLKNFSKKYNYKDIIEKINSLSDLKVLLIGDGIIDEYHYCHPMGKASKANLVVSKYLDHEVFAGGAFAIANHLAGICDDVHLVSLLGSHDSREEFINNNLRPNITTRFFTRDDGPSIVKKRYLDQYLSQKIFEVNYLNDTYIDESIEADVAEHLISEMPKYDLVLISDFGHGFITKKIIDVIEDHSKKFAVNTQTNASNKGYNMITKYNRPYFVCLDESEVRLAAQNRFGNIEAITSNIKKAIESENMIVTLGKKGSFGLNDDNDSEYTPIFSSKVVDTIGAGDAFFAFTAPCFAKDLPLDLVSFIGNCVGALAVQIVGNKEPIEKYKLLEFITTILK